MWFYSKLSSVKSSAQTSECFEGVKYSLFISISHFPHGDLESANFGFWVVFLWNSLWIWNQNSFNFLHFLELTNSDVISFISDNFPAIFPTTLRLWRLKNSCKHSLKKLGRAWRNIGKYITVHPNRTVSLSEFNFFKLAIAFADQNPPGSGTFDLSVGPF